jgi:hypothetical protein
MGIDRRWLRRSSIAVGATVAVLGGAGSALALVGLPLGGQVNDDPAAGIDPALNVGDEGPANADVVAGALTAGQLAVPWAVFRQQESAGAKDQIFSRSFAGGVWTTRGNRTVNGSSSASPMFSGSLNFDQAEDGEAPAIDFAGAGRTVPWVTWYEHTTGVDFSANNIFASRFDNTGDANQGKWILSGQSRGTGGSGNVPVPSLNIHTDEDAENPSVAGGTLTPGANPGPWITWQETSVGVGNTDQIFVVRPIGPGSTNCTGVTPGGSASAPPGGFCWQETGIDRVAGDPSLNVDPARDGIEPDIAFAGSGDNVPWVVWYETGTPTSGLQGPNGIVFAAKGVGASSAEGQLEWTVVGNGGQGALEATINGPGTCAHSLAEEQACSLNANPTADAEDPRVAAGTMNPANPTVPWVVWDEGVGGHQAVFVSRLVGSGAAARFVLANDGQPISPVGIDATGPDITFSGNTPYVTFRTDRNGVSTAVTGHFVNAADPTFVTDNGTIPLTPSTLVDVRDPISSGCTANPFNADGVRCQGGAVGTPFFLFTNGTSPTGLFADAYQPEAPATGSAEAVGQSTATVSGSVNPLGSSTSVSFQYGVTVAYGQSTPAQTTPPDEGVDVFSAALSGLPAGTIIHYRAVVTTDFGTETGTDQTFTTTSPPPAVPAAPPAGKPSVTLGKASVGRARVSGTTALVPITCRGDTSCMVSLKLTVTKTRRVHRAVAVSAHSTQAIRRTVVVGKANATVKAGHRRTVRVRLNPAGRELRAARHRMTAKLTVSQRRAHRSKPISKQKVTFAIRRPPRR